LADEGEPFIIGCYFGESKPEDLVLFLGDTCAEIADLKDNGVTVHGKTLPFSVGRLIMDAEARAFVKCIMHHNAFEGCEKCSVRGVRFLRRTVFLDQNAPLRTDDSFVNRATPGHHKELQSPLEVIGIGMVSQFCLDGLHLVYIGVFLRWLNFLLKERGPFTVDDETLEAMSGDFLAIKPYCPAEFNSRKPRQIKRQGNHFKAKELRRILLYDGLKIFKKKIGSKFV